jgi:AcrR family transcriptional regulator
MSDSSLIRPYRGVAAGDRIANRRDALIDAALEVFAAEGWSAISARRVCEQAGLTRRYFYESFDDVDALTGAVFQRISAEVIAAVRAATIDRAATVPELARRAVAAGLDALTDPPAKGQFLAMAQRADGSVAEYRARALDEFASIVQAVLSAERESAGTIESRDARIAALTAVGAVLTIVDSWLGREIDLSREELISWSTTAALAIIDALPPAGDTGADSNG